MKRALVIMLTASLLLAGCGKGADNSSKEEAPAAEATVEEATEEEAEEVVEEAETEAETAAETAAETVAEPEATAEEAPAEEAPEAEDAVSSKIDNSEVIAGAQDFMGKTSAFTSDLGKTEQNDFGEQELVDFSYGGYVFKIPANWIPEGQNITLEDSGNSAAIITLQTQQNDSFSSLTSEDFANRAMESDIVAESNTGIENVDSSPVEMIEILGGDKAVAQSFSGTSQGIDLEGIMIMGLDQEKSALYVIVFLQSTEVKTSHFNDFKTFVSTMTRE